MPPFLTGAISTVNRPPVMPGAGRNGITLKIQRAEKGILPFLMTVARKNAPGLQKNFFNHSPGVEVSRRALIPCTKYGCGK